MGKVNPKLVFNARKKMCIHELSGIMAKLDAMKKLMPDNSDECEKLKSSVMTLQKIFQKIGTKNE